jgi:dynein heavy chain
LKLKQPNFTGHSLSVIGDLVYLFGGNDFRKPAGPNNDLYKLDMSSNDFYWTKVESSARWPEPRSHHSAVVYGSKIIIFGGFRSSSTRYNDIWILDTTNDEWTQPHQGATRTNADGEVVFLRHWPDVPLPRGAHSATLIGTNQMYVFGGYGGSGYARRDFFDVSVLDLETWEWRALECKGDIPEARSGHQGVAVQDSLYIIGGWNSLQQFDDLYILDTNTNTWNKPFVNGDFGPPRWNFSAVSVFAVPYWKVFVFGGNSGNLNDGGSPQGQYLNDMIVLETGSKTWTRPAVLGNIPSQRGETPIVYDPKLSRLVLFGGWSNRWFGDLFVCKVDEVVGPPYAIDSITPPIGPITGSTRCIINGVGFTAVGPSSTSAQIRFACLKGYLEVSGEVIDNTSIRFETPNFEKYGPCVVEGRARVGGFNLTNSVISFSYFAVASCDTTLSFGPAIIDGCLAKNSVCLIIQARDATGEFS